MPTSPQQLFLGVLGLLAVAAADAQAQVRPAAKTTSQLLGLVNHRPATAGQAATAARGITATVVRPGQEVGYYWEKTTNRWAVSNKRLNTYDSQARLIQQVEQDSATAANFSRSLYAFNARGQETSYTQQNWTNNAWVNNYRYLTDYDANGGETLFRSQRWSGSAWVTEQAYQTVNTYNAAGILTQRIDQELVNGVYVNSGRVTYTVTNGQWSSLLSEDWDNGAWVIDERILDIVWYDWANQQVASFRVQTFDGTNFVDDGRFSITYGANGSYVEISEEYLNGAWVNSRRYTTTKDSQGNELAYVGEDWVNNAWRQKYGERSTLVYGAGNVLLRQARQEFDDVTRQYANTYRTNYSSFQTIVLAARNAALEARAVLYPNPTAGVVTLDIAGVQGSATARGEVYNALGQLVRQFTVLPRASKISTQLDLSGLQSGLYTLRLQTGDGTIVKRVVRN
ncbi:T9SS type A sorting domain-containing protein [Hymenobacter rubripertinctus]|uniref:T9SS C-terminal target domain-containing protein n=1 Tax=Hymenobacter rubripertinctus TaxID=2029981 RepID=A0A418QLG9_9BACT|nr:T9SS type A sorting domain-containing protein [Hymenobacter rubripertinctus]RIY06103.1 T9SS C-terminal target domain-containing protein [Hymenobacter rubripertinctus]